MGYESNNEEEGLGEEKKEINDDDINDDLRETSNDNEWDEINWSDDDSGEQEESMWNEIDWSEENSGEQEESIWDEIDWRDDNTGDKEGSIWDEIDWNEPENGEQVEFDPNDLDGELEPEQFDPNEDGDIKFDPKGDDDDVENYSDGEENLRTSCENINSQSTSTVLISENKEEIQEGEQNELEKEIEKELEEGVEVINKYLEEEAEFINAYQKIVAEARELEKERESEGEERHKTEEEWEKEVETAAYTAEQLYESMKEIETETSNEEISEKNEETEQFKEQEEKEELEAQAANTIKEETSELEEEPGEGEKELEQHQVEVFIEEELETEPEPVVNEEEIERLQELGLEEQFQTVHINEQIEELYEKQEEEKNKEKDEQEKENTQEIKHQSTYLQERLEEQEQELELEYEEKDEIEQHQVEATIDEELETEPEPIINEEKLEHIKNLEPEKQLEAELFYELIEKLANEEKEEREEEEEQEEISTEQKVVQIMCELEIHQEMNSGEAEVEFNNQEVKIDRETPSTEKEEDEQREIDENIDHQQELEEILEQNKKIEQEALAEIEQEEEDSDKTAEKIYESAKELYRQQTGKRPIYANKETKGFKQWLELKKKSEGKQQEEERKEQKKEETWMWSLKNWIVRATEIDPELKSKLLKLAERYKEFEKLIKKYTQLYSKAQREKLSQTEKSELKSLIKSLQKLDPIEIELFLGLREIKRYLDEQYYYDFWDKPYVNRVRHHFFTLLSQKYKSLKEAQKKERYEEMLRNWIEEASEEEINPKLKADLKELIENYNKLDAVAIMFMKLYTKAQSEILSNTEQKELDFLVRTLQKIDPSKIELFLKIKAIRHYLNDINLDDLSNKTRVNRVLSKFFKQISQKILKLKDLINLDTRKILMTQTSRPDENVKILLNKNEFVLKGYTYVRNEILREHKDEVIYSKILGYADIVLKKQIKLGKLPLYKTAQIRLTTQQKLVDIYEGKDYVTEKDKFYEFVNKYRDYEALVYLIKCKNGFPGNWFKGKKYFGYTHSTEKIRFRYHIREAIEQYMDYHNRIRSEKPTKLNRAICIALEDLGYRINEICFLFEVEDVYSQIKFLEKLAYELEENYFDVINLAFHKKLKTAIKHEIKVIAKHGTISELNELGGGQGGQPYISLPLYDIVGMIALGCTQKRIWKIINQLYKDDFNREKIAVNTLRRRIIEEFNGWVNAQKLFLKPIVEALIYKGFSDRKIYNTLSPLHSREGWLYAWWKNGEELDFRSWSELDESKIKRILKNYEEKYCGIPKSKWEEWVIKEVPNYEIAKVTRLNFDTIVSTYKDIFGGRNNILFKYRREATIKMREVGMSLKEIYTSIFNKTYYPSNFIRDFKTWFDGMTPKQIEERWGPNNDRNKNEEI